MARLRGAGRALTRSGYTLRDMPEISPALYRAGSGEPLVLLHGFTGAWMHWRPLLAELSRRYEVIAPTLDGHAGGRAYPSSSPMSFDGSADALSAHLDELGVGTAHLVGNSMGGALALELAKRGRARSVVALAPAGGWTQGDGEARRLARFFARQQRVSRALEARMPMIVARAKVRRMALRDIMRRGDLVPASDALRLVELSLGCTIAERAIRALREDRGLVLGDLDRIECPVLLATPQFDRVLPPERHAPRLRREIPHVQAIVLSNCGHVPMWDDTPLVIRTIVEFVDRRTPEGATTVRDADSSEPIASAPQAAEQRA
jgi:pimeloyl-ACP methyl ester carboxylesterase